MIDMPPSDLSRATVHEPARDWPDQLRIVAQWGKKSRSIVIDRDAYFGLRGAPLTGDQLIHMVENLRRAKP